MSIRYFTAPGRVEIGGNHTDHQHGRVLAAAVGLEIVAAAEVNGSKMIRLFGAHGDCGIISSDPADLGGADRGSGTNRAVGDAVTPDTEVDLSFSETVPDEKGTSAALVRGIAHWFSQHEYPVGGFDAAISSTIPVGAGLSSSAAFAVLIGNIFKGLFNADISPIEIARAGQYAENTYFGKPSGLMDQTASSFGGLNVIDFVNPQNPAITPVRADLTGFSMCVVNTGGSHADLTPDYAASTSEMKAIAAHFGKRYLREVCPDEFASSIPELRLLGDRAVLRAIHFFAENDRVLMQAAALECGDIRSFLDLVTESGRSSFTYLQNVYSPSNPQEQGLSLALALSENILEGEGAWRVHGGGFAGTILAFVPDELRENYSLRMTDVFGTGCCHYLNIRKDGGGEISNA